MDVQYKNVRCKLSRLHYSKKKIKAACLDRPVNWSVVAMLRDVIVVFTVVVRRTTHRP